MTTTINHYDQAYRPNHENCTRWENDPRWWFDNGELCERTDWHADD